MNLKTKIASLIERYQEPVKQYVLSLRDVRNVGTLAFAVLVLLVTWSGVQAIQTNYNLERKVSQLAKANEIQKLENENIKLKNNYYGTSQYLEVAARQNLGLASPGETQLIVPRETALKYTVPMPDDNPQQKADSQLPFWQRNFRDWMNFFLGRPGD